MNPYLNAYLNQNIRHLNHWIYVQYLCTIVPIFLVFQGNVRFVYCFLYHMSHGIQSFRGSIPLISTTSPENQWFSGLFLLLFGGFSAFSAFSRTGAIHPGSRYFSYQNCTRIRLVPMRPMCLDGTCPGGLKMRRKICRLLPAGWAPERGGNGPSYPHRRVPRYSE